MTSTCLQNKQVNDIHVSTKQTGQCHPHVYKTNRSMSSTCLQNKQVNVIHMSTKQTGQCHPHVYKTNRSMSSTCLQNKQVNVVHMSTKQTGQCHPHVYKTNMSRLARLVSTKSDFTTLSSDMILTVTPAECIPEDLIYNVTGYLLDAGSGTEIRDFDWILTCTPF